MLYPTLFSVVSITPIWLFRFKLIKNKFKKVISSVMLDTFHVLSSYMRLVATILDSPNIEYSITAFNSTNLGQVLGP